MTARFLHFSGVDTFAKAVAAAGQPIKVLATGTVADNSIQGLVTLDDETLHWILLPSKRQPQ